MVVELEPHAQQQPALEHAAGHRRIADGAQQDCVVGAQFVDQAVGHDLTRGVVAAGADVVGGLLHPGGDDVEHLERFVDDLGSDAVAGDDGQSS